MTKKQSEKKLVLDKILSDRGEHLRQAHQAQQESNIHNDQPVVIGQNKDGEDIRIRIGSKCPTCRMRVRGPNHVEGAHHRGVVPHCGRR